MAEPLTIDKADSLDGREIVIILSDGRALILTLEQILTANPQVVLPDKGDEDSKYSLHTTGRHDGLPVIRWVDGLRQASANEIGVSA